MRCDHPGLTRGLEVVEAPSAQGVPGEPCLVMEFIQGQSFSQLLKREGQEPPSESALVHVAFELATILEELHHHPSEPLVHGDISAKNLLVGPSGKLTLIDLGSLAPAGSHSLDAGTPRYAAPERQEEALILAPSLDIYGVGALLWELAMGACWDTERSDLIVQESTSGHPIMRIIARASASDATKRFQSASELRQTLDPLLSAKGEAAWRRWLNHEVAEGENSVALRSDEGLKAWAALVGALGLITWVGLWFIAQMT